LADYLGGYVSSSSIAVGNAERKVVSNGFNLFGQDDWKLTPRLSLTLGLRYEYFGPLHNGDKNLAVFLPGQGFKIQGAGINSLFPSDYNNFAPRVGFAFQPTGKGDLVIRGGIGIFYDQINMNPFLDFRPPIHGADGIQDNPVGPDVVDNYSANVNGQTSYVWAANQQIFPGVTSCPTLSGCGTNTYNVYSVNQNFRTPYFYNFNLQVEKSLGDAASVQIGYVGSAAHKLNVMLNLNQNPVTLASTGGPYSALYPNVGSILQLNSDGNSNYSSLQMILKTRGWHGLTSQFAYTWAHALDDVTQYRGVIPLDSFKLAAEYGSGDFDTRHNFVAYATYDVPGASKGPRILTWGWQFSGNISLHTGQPFNYNAGTQRPGLDQVCNPFAGVSHSFSAAAGGTQWINPNCFVAVSGLGGVGRNTYYGPGFASVDFSVIKNIPIKESLKVQLRAEMFNIFNRINLASGSGSVGGNGYVNDTIGDFNGAPGLGPGEPFNMQLVAKIIF
jgi:hypothetical protein